MVRCLPSQKKVKKTPFLLPLLECWVLHGFLKSSHLDKDEDDEDDDEETDDDEYEDNGVYVSGGGCGFRAWYLP